jgi:hypothetical protein
MKKAILFGALALAAASAVANAGIIVASTDTPAGTGGNDSTFDEITFTITGWTGADGAPLDGVQGIIGTFSAGGGGVLSVPAKLTAPTHPYTTYITNVLGGLDAVGTTPASYANFENQTAASESSASQTPTSFGATWFTTGIHPGLTTDTRLAPGTPINPNFDNNLLAQIFVTPGDTVSFSGTVGTTAGTSPLSFSGPVPEPASLGLLALGAGGLLARRRK